MLTEIEVEGLGTMRHLNVWQLDRIKRMRPGLNKEIALVSFGLGLTVQQFKKLDAGQRKAAIEAQNRLYAPTPFIQPGERQRPRTPRRGEHVSIERQIAIGRDLIRVKGQLPHGHFRLWVEDKSGITYTQARRYMKAAKEAPAPPSAAA